MREARAADPKADLVCFIGALPCTPKCALQDPGWSVCALRRPRANPVPPPAHARWGLGTSHAVRCQTSRSAPLQRVLRFQGVSPLTNPLRPSAVSSGESLAPPMGLVPLQGPSPSVSARLSAEAAWQPASWPPCGPGSRDAVANHGGASRVDPFGGCPASRVCTGSAPSQQRGGFGSRRGAFSASSGEPTSRSVVPAAEAVTSAGVVPPESVRMVGS
jgi:hypothetical protein